MTVVTGNTYQIDTDSKQVWNRLSTFTFYEDSVEISSSDISSIDYLFGKVTFSTSKTGSITVDGDYLPTSLIAGGYEATMNRTNQLFTSTDQSNAGFETKETGIKDVNITVSRFDDLSGDFVTILNSGTPIVVEFAPVSTKVYRGWFILSGKDQTIDVNALIEDTLTFDLSGDDEEGKTFSRN
jgi:hypothetical protein